MENQLELLVIEDNQKHLQAAKAFFDERIRTGLPLNVEYASTFKETYERLASKRYDGILTDVFLPYTAGEEESDWGVYIAERAFEYGIPTILVTSTYHHGIKTSRADTLARRKHIALVDRAEAGQSGEAETKEWPGAFVALMYAIEGQKEGMFNFTKEGVINKNPDEGWLIAIVISGLVNNLQYARKMGNLADFVQETLETRLRHDPLIRKIIETYCRGLFE